MRRAHEILVLPSETKNHSGFVVTIKYALIFVEEDRSTYLHILGSAFGFGPGLAN